MEPAAAAAEFDHLWTDGRRTDPPSAVYEKAEAEFVQVGIEFFRKHSNMAAMVLECTGMPPLVCTCHPAGH